MSNNLSPRVKRKIAEAKEKQLTELDLNHEYLTEIPSEILELTHLEVLTLSWNEITEIPEEINKLSKLKELHLFGNSITNCPKNLLELLPNLTYLGIRLSFKPKISISKKIISQVAQLGLDLSSNELKEVPEFLSNFTNLTTLYLSNNKVQKIPEFLFKITNLTELYLANNELKEIPKSISELTNLTTLSLGDNQLKEIPKSISKLTNLTILYLANNELREIPKSISKITNLTELYLANNELKEIPESIIKLPNFILLSLAGNPLENPPLEICEKGIEEIRKYFRQLREGRDYLYQAKLLIVGEGEVGKTTLANKIQNSDYQLQNEDSTQGIDVIPFTFPLPSQLLASQKDNLEQQLNRDFVMNIWDFGGQEIYHATHQFFLTKRSLYVLVIDNRKEDDNLSYWLNIVELLSDNSPILIIKNEKGDRQRNINENALRGRFSNLQEILATNLATKKNWDLIINKIQHYITNLDHIGDILPKTWIKVKDILEQDQRNYISLEEYLKICQENGFKNREYSLQLSDYLHDLGICLHFQDDRKSLLYKTVILKPEWGTNAVYKVLDNEEIINNFGKFTEEDLALIWSEEKYINMQGELLNLMMRFQLCYEIPNQKNTYIAPQLLEENQPDYEWQKENNLILRYEYEFMPKGIITQFIVIMHRLIYQQKYVWKNGVILFENDTLAEIVESYDKREIKIRVVGKSKKELLTKITYEFGKIHDTYEQLKYNKLVPCNCSGCKNTQNPHFYQFENLQTRIKNGKSTIECNKPPFEDVNIHSLIDDIIDVKQQQQLKNQDKNSNNQLTLNIDINQGEGIMNNVNQNHSGSGNNIAGDKNETNYYIQNSEIMNDKIEIKGGNIGVVKNEGGINDNATVAGKIQQQINPQSPEKIAEIATTLEKLLDYFEKENTPTNFNFPEAQQKIENITENNPEILEGEIIREVVEKNPTLRQRIEAGIKAGFLTFLGNSFPPIGIAIEAVKAFQQPE